MSCGCAAVKMKPRALETGRMEVVGGKSAANEKQRSRAEIDMWAAKLLAENSKPGRHSC